MHVKLLNQHFVNTGENIVGWHTKHHTNERRNIFNIAGSECRCCVVRQRNETKWVLVSATTGGSELTSKSATNDIRKPELKQPLPSLHLNTLVNVLVEVFIVCFKFMKMSFCVDIGKKYI